MDQDGLAWLALTQTGEDAAWRSFFNNKLQSTLEKEELDISDCGCRRKTDRHFLQLRKAGFDLCVRQRTFHAA
jgi:hypothetical protein